MTWLAKQKDTLLRDWIRRTQTPMMATLPGGSILWCNSAFEDLLGWTSVELIDKKSWIDLTDNPDDLEADLTLSAEVVSGLRTAYQLHKPFRTKEGQPVRVVIDVIRFPQRGEFECFLVSAIPTDRGVHFALGQLTEIHSLMLEMIKQSDSCSTNECRPDRIDSFFSWVAAKPVIGYPIIAFFAALLFGSRVVELLKELFPGTFGMP